MARADREAGRGRVGFGESEGLNSDSPRRTGQRRQRDGWRAVRLLNRHEIASFMARDPGRLPLRRGRLGYKDRRRLGMLVKANSVDGDQLGRHLQFVDTNVPLATRIADGPVEPCHELANGDKTSAAC
jgi:hypothetical protein